MRVLKCSVCGKEFVYNKRGRTPKHPLCKEHVHLKWQGKEKKKIDDIMPAAPQNGQATAAQPTPRPQPPRPRRPRRRRVQELSACTQTGLASLDSEGKVLYFDFLPLNVDELKEGDLLYWIPKRLVNSEKYLHTDGKLVEFISFDEENPGYAFVRVCRKRGRKTVQEEYRTKFDYLTRFSVRKVPADQIYSPMILASAVKSPSDAVEQPRKNFVDSE